MMAVKLALAQSGEMLAASQHARLAQPRQELARVADDFFRIVRNRTRTQHRARSLECQVKHRGKIHVEAKSAAVFADHTPMLAKKRAASRGKNLGRRRRR